VEVAVIVTVAAPDGVNNPEALTVPLLADQVTLGVVPLLPSL
jgi:hypothetical protein